MYQKIRMKIYRLKMILKEEKKEFYLNKII